MSVLIEQYWWLLVVALLIGLTVAWWIFRGTRKTRVESTLSTDVLAEGAAPAKRNQAYIDAPPASLEPEMPPPTPQGMSGVGTAVAAGAQMHEHLVHEAEHATEDDLTRIKGVGPRLVQLLKSLGITRFEQIAAWNDEEVDRFDAQLGNFQGRIRRDSWVEQAGYLAKGDIAGFESRFGKV